MNENSTDRSMISIVFVVCEENEIRKNVFNSIEKKMFYTLASYISRLKKFRHINVHLIQSRRYATYTRLITYIHMIFLFIFTFLSFFLYLSDGMINKKKLWRRLRIWFVFFSSHRVVIYLFIFFILIEKEMLNEIIKFSYWLERNETKSAFVCEHFRFVLSINGFHKYYGRW